MHWLAYFDFLHLPSKLLDLPGIIEGAKDGKGRGRQVIAGKDVIIVPLLVVFIDQTSALVCLSIFCIGVLLYVSPF